MATQANTFHSLFEILRIWESFWTNTFICSKSIVSISRSKSVAPPLSEIVLECKFKVVGMGFTLFS